MTVTTVTHAQRVMIAMLVRHVMIAHLATIEPLERIVSTAIRVPLVTRVRRATRTSTPVVTNALSLSFRRMT
jgi:hypothetical protein